MNYTEAKEKLHKYSQEQLLRFYDELDLAGKSGLLSEIESLDPEFLKEIIRKQDDAAKANDGAANGRSIGKCGTDAAGESSGNGGNGISIGKCGAETISPIGAMQLDLIQADADNLTQEGIEAIKERKVAAVLLAGGQGTRLGLDGPKGTLNVGITKELYLFECLIGNITEVKEKAGEWIPLYIMTSEKNDSATRSFFEEHNYFGYNRDFVRFFVQEMAPSTDFDGKILLERKDHISLSPNGNGGWFLSMQKNGLDREAKELGVEWLNVFSVDNPLQKIADPMFVGATIKSEKPIGSKVVRKASPEEKVGVMCMRGGHPSIVEYYELSDEMRNERNADGSLSYGYGVILNYLFNMKALSELPEENMPYHLAEKKISHIDAEGSAVSPEEPNGYKYEKLVLDLIQMMDDCLVFEVDRAKEFAPIKNMHGTDSLDSARIMLKNNGVEL